MTTTSSYQLQGDAARVYEAQKVPAIFRPLAEQTLNAVAPTGAERVLDVACGTGIVARLAAGRAGAGARVIGVDLNAGMLEVARACAANDGVAPEFRVADVGALPFDDASFDVVFCQQGLQFFPDRPRALDEMRRVLAPGGRIALSVWSEASPLFVAMADGVRRHVDTTLAERVLDPFSFRDGEVIGGLELLSGDHGSSGALDSLLQRDVVGGNSHGGFEEAFGAAGPHRGANLACDRRVGDDHSKSGQDVDQIGGADQCGGGEGALQLGVGERCFGEFGFGAVASGDVDRVFVDPCPR